MKFLNNFAGNIGSDRKGVDALFLLYSGGGGEVPATTTGSHGKYLSSYILQPRTELDCSGGLKKIENKSLKLEFKKAEARARSLKNGA